MAEEREDIGFDPAVRDRICELVADEEVAQSLLFCDGFDNCIVGVVDWFGQPPRVCYDVEAMLAHMVEFWDLSYEDAVEYFEFNVAGAYVGEFTPAFLRRPFEY